MDDLINNLISFSIGFMSLAGMLKAYFDKYNIKLAPFNKVQEYRQFKEIVGILTKNISKDELLKILNFVIEMKATKTSITVDDVATVGKMLFEAVTTEE